MNFNLTYAIDQFSNIVKYAHITILLAIISMFFAFIISIVLVIIRHYKIKVLYQISNGYIAFFRGTPLVTQLFFLYYGLAQLIPAFRGLSGFWAAIIGLSMNASAYMAEGLRGVVDSIEKGQIEAGLSVGLTNMQIMRHIILPQTIRIAFPMLTNDFIDLIKSSSLAFVLGVRDIMAQTSMIGSSSYKYFECYFDAIIIYFIIVKIVTILQKKIENKINSAY